MQIRGLFIGKLYSPATMGYYSKAYGTEKIASLAISQVLGQVTYPLYAEVQDDRGKLQHIIKRLSSSIAYLTFPLMFALILIAKPIFIFLYSERWVDSVYFFQILCLAGLAVCLQSVNLQTISAIGKSRVMFIWSLIKQGLGLVLVIGGLFLWGLEGLMWGTVIHAWNCTLINMLLVSKYIGFKTTKQLLDILPIAVVTFVAYVCSIMIGRQFELGLYGDGLLKFSVFATIYVGWSFFFRPAPFTYLKGIAFSRIYKRKKR